MRHPHAQGEAENLRLIPHLAGRPKLLRHSRLSRHAAQTRSWHALALLQRTFAGNQIQPALRLNSYLKYIINTC